MPLAVELDVQLYCLDRLAETGALSVPNTAGKSTVLRVGIEPDGAAAVTMKLPLFVPVGA